MKNQLKDYIKQNLLTKTGTLNVAIIRREHFITSEIAKSIIKETEFLNIYNPTLGERILTLLRDIDKITYCLCGKPVKLFTSTCGDKICKNNAISNSKQKILNNNPLKNNDDNENKEIFLKLKNENKIEQIIEEVKCYIKNNLIKANDHLNIERILSLNNSNLDIFNKIMILTYFCNNNEIDLLNRIKLILYNKTELEYCCICGKVKKLENSKEIFYTASCGDPECYYKLVGEASKKNKDLINDIKTKNLVENKDKFKEDLEDFLNNLEGFNAIEYNTFKKQIIDDYKNNIKDNDYNVFGTNRAYLQFKNNETFIKNLIFYTSYIKTSIDSLDINQRIYHIINDIKELPKCKTCNDDVCEFKSIKEGYRIYCKKCFPFIYNSKGEIEIFNYIKSFDLNVEQSNRSIIAPRELDIVISEKKIAIEFDGNYWHSEIAGNTSLYHLDKTNNALLAGYQLIHIFEDEWVNKQHIVKARLRNILGLTKYKIYARKCEVREIDNKTKNEFLEKYHIQGKDVSSTRLGLFYKNRLVAIMTFSARRFDDKEGFELVRYATISNFNIVGGAGKLLANFRKAHINETIISYADKRWSQGNLYKKLGFTLIRESLPNYFYIKIDNFLIRHSRIEFQKHKLEDLLENFDKSLSEHVNMKNNNYTRIWDCGNYVFELK